MTPAPSPQNRPSRGDSGSGIKAQRVTTAWNIETLRWDNQPSATTSGATVAKDPGGCTDSAAPPSDVAWSWPVTGIVQTWASGQGNHGLLLRGTDESASAPLYDRGFHASEVSEMPNPHPPVLKVTYTDGAAPSTSPTPTATATSGPDTAPPTILSVEPADGADNVLADAQVKVIFSEPVTDAHFSLVNIFEETEIPGSVAMSSGNTVLTFTPNAPLDFIYWAEVSGAKDAAGNTMGEPYSWMFSIGSPASRSQKHSRAVVAMRETKPSVSKLWTRSVETKDGTTVTGTTTPQLMVKVADPLRRRSAVQVQIEHDPSTSPQSKGLIWSGEANISAGSVATVQVPRGKLAKDWTVRWRARAGAGTWSEWNRLVIASDAISRGQADSGAMKSTTTASQGARAQFAPPDFPYDPIDFTQCWNNMNRATRPGGYTKNSFNWCGSWYMGRSQEAGLKSKVVEVKATTGFVGWRFSYAVRTVVGNKVSKRKGMSQAQLDAAKAVAEVGARNVEVWVFVDEVTPNENWPDSDNMFEESKLAINFEMKSDPGGACKPLAGHDNSAQSRTFAQWDTNHQHHFRFTSDKWSSKGTNRVATCTLIPRLYYDDGLTSDDDEYIYNKPHEKVALQKAFRCDTSDLILMHYGGCVFDELSPTLGLSTANTLQYKGKIITNKAKDHAVHIKEAMTSGKKIPGSPDRIIQNPLSPTPLTRARSGNHPGDTEYENRKVVQAACADAFGADYFAKTKKHCDEYPYATTLEGAANDFFDYSVKLISVTSNTAAGSTQSIFWQRYRVLPGDTFYVKIYGGQPPQ